MAGKTTGEFNRLFVPLMEKKPNYSRSSLSQGSMIMD